MNYEDISLANNRIAYTRIIEFGELASWAMQFICRGAGKSILLRPYPRVGGYQKDMNYREAALSSLR